MVVEDSGTHSTKSRVVGRTLNELVRENVSVRTHFENPSTPFSSHSSRFPDGRDTSRLRYFYFLFSFFLLY